MFISGRGIRQADLLRIAVILLFAACTPSTREAILTATPEPSFTPHPTLTSTPSQTPISRPTLTHTLIPSPTSPTVPPLTVHKWHPKTILVKMESGGGDGCCRYSYPASFVLYANGRVIISENFEENGDWHFRLLTRKYSRRETCAILNTIDQTGFLDYNPDEYRPQGSDFFSIDGSATTRITVNSWRSNYGGFYALYSYLYLEVAHLGQVSFPPIPPALRDLYYFIMEYPVDGFELYQPQRLGLVVSKPIGTQQNVLSLDWPFDEFSLAEIKKITSTDDYPSSFVVIEGKPALSIYSYLGNSFDYGETVRQNGQEYAVFARPILPYEIPQFHTWNILPDPNIEPPGFELECYPSDGVLPIPVPPTPTP